MVVCMEGVGMGGCVCVLLTAKRCLRKITLIVGHVHSITHYYLFKSCRHCCNYSQNFGTRVFIIAISIFSGYLYML